MSIDFESKRADEEEDDDDDDAELNAGAKTAFQQALESQEDEVISGPLEGHAGSVECLKFFRSSKGPLRLASGSMDTTVRVWNPKSQTCLLVLFGHTAPVMCIDAFKVPEKNNIGDATTDSKISPRLVSGSEDCSVRVWSVEGAGSTGSCLVELNGHNAPVYGLVCFADALTGKPRCASSSEDATLRVWDPCVDKRTGVAAKANSHGGDGRKQVGSQRNGLARDSGVVSRSGSESLPAGCLAVLEGHSGWVNCVATFAAVDKMANTARSKDRTGSLGSASNLDFPSSASARLTPLHKEAPLSLSSTGPPSPTPNTKAGSLSPLGGHSAGDAEAPSSSEVSSTAAATVAGAPMVAGKKEERSAAAAATTSSASSATSSAQSGAPSVARRGAAAGGKPGRSEPATARLVSGSMDMTLRVWDPTGTRLGILKGHKSWVHTVVCFEGPGGEARCASGSTDRTIRIWDPLKFGAALGVIDAHKAHVWCLSSFLDSQGQVRLISGSDDKVFRAWDPERRKGVASNRDHRKAIKACDGITTTPPGREGVGRYVASGGEDNVVYVKKWGDFMGGVSSRKAS